MDTFKFQSGQRSFDDLHHENQDLKMLILKLNQDKIMNEKKILRRNTEILRLKQCLQDKDEQLFTNNLGPIMSVKSTGQIDFESKDQYKLNQLVFMILKHKESFLQGSDQVELILAEIIQLALINKLQPLSVPMQELNLSFPGKKSFEKSNQDLEKEVVQLQEQTRIDSKRIIFLEDQVMDIKRDLQNQIQDQHYLTQQQQFKEKFLFAKLQVHEKDFEEIQLNTLRDQSIKEQILTQYLKLKIKYNECSKALKSEKIISSQAEDIKDYFTSSPLGRQVPLYDQ